MVYPGPDEVSGEDLDVVATTYEGTTVVNVELLESITTIVNGTLAAEVTSSGPEADKLVGREPDDESEAKPDAETLAGVGIPLGP